MCSLDAVFGAIPYKCLTHLEEMRRGVVHWDFLGTKLSHSNPHFPAIALYDYLHPGQHGLGVIHSSHVRESVLVLSCANVYH